MLEYNEVYALANDGGNDFKQALSTFSKEKDPPSENGSDLSTKGGQ